MPLPAVQNGVVEKVQERKLSLLKLYRNGWTEILAVKTTSFIL